MTLIFTILQKYWKHILIVIVFLTVLIVTYSKIYNKGFDAANIVCEKRIQEYTQKMTEYEKALDNRIAIIEEASSVLITEAIESRKNIKKDFNVILQSIKNKPLYVIEQGKCAPSPDLIKAYNDAISRVNIK